MNDDLEPACTTPCTRIAAAGPASLFEALERVPDAPVRSRQRRGARPDRSVSSRPRPSSSVASAVALTGGSAPKPGPTAQSSPLASTQVSTVWNTDGATALVIHRDPTDKGKRTTGGHERSTRSG